LTVPRAFYEALTRRMSATTVEATSSASLETVGLRRR
jgi:hypothetical protein